MRFTVIRAEAGARSGSVAPLVVAATGLLLALLAFVSAAHASSSCPNEVFRTGPGATLPDCRAYELVSPPNKNGGEVDGGIVFPGSPPPPEQAALDGEAVTYASQTTFTEANPLAGALSDEYLSRRGPDGWSTQEITPEQDLPGGAVHVTQGVSELSLYQGFSENLEHGFLTAYEPSPVAGAPAGYFNPYVRESGDGAYRLLSSRTPPVAEPGIADVFHGLRVQYGGMSADGSRVAFAASDALTPEAIPGQEALYESNEGHLELVSVLPDGEQAGSAVAFGSLAGHYLEGELDEGYSRAVAVDGSRVFWTYQPGNHLAPSQIYMHELTADGSRTVQVSASQKTNGGSSGGSPLTDYWTASSDGSRVFFTSSEQLTNDSTAAGEGAEDLYMYEPSGTGEPGRLSDLTVDPTVGQTADVHSVLGASENGSYVYFVADGVLAEGASSSEHNIYVWHEGVVSLIASFSEKDYAAGGAYAGGKNLSPTMLLGNARYLVGAATFRVSPDGRYLAFESSEPLTGYDNVPAQTDACEGFKGAWPSASEGGDSSLLNGTGRCVEVYEYDASAGRLTCVSCNERGLPPVGNSVVPMTPHKLNLAEPGWQTPTVQQRYLLDDGRLFFDSADELLPQASNGRLNVYEFEPVEVGGCQRETGCLALISSGTSSESSFFMDASVSGSDVFFITRQQLVAEDGDEALDVYDARVDGGFSPAVPAPCGGEACRPSAIPAPSIYGAPPSATFVGPGNPPQPATQPTVKSTPKPKAKRKTKRKRKTKKKTGSGKDRKSARRSRTHGSSRGGWR